ncbi:MAG TPA: hypothetical protein VGO67_08680 [Verrucomicrobiae bacterium]|jgi:hypothetical protein
MIDEFTLAQMNGLYVCPPDAGPGWREAMEAGFDMTLIEAALAQTPQERLDEHQAVLDFAWELQQLPNGHPPE